MRDAFERKVTGAAVALWWVVLLGAVLFGVSWVAYLNVQPNTRLASLWGGNMSWETVQIVWLAALAIFKFIVWLMAMTALWLTLWARQLRKTIA